MPELQPQPQPRTCFVPLMIAFLFACPFLANWSLRAADDQGTPAQWVEQLADEEWYRARFKLLEHVDQAVPVLAKAWNHSNAKVKEKSRLLLLALADSLHPSAIDAVKKIAPKELEKHDGRRIAEAYRILTYGETELDQQNRVTRLGQGGFKGGSQSPPLDAFLAQHLKHLKQLVVLDVGDKTLSDKGLVDLHKATSLEVLDLESTKITKETMKKIGSLQSLRTLNIERTGISDAGLAHLQGLKKLDKLNVTYTKITGSGFKHFRNVPLTNLNATLYTLTDSALQHIGQIKTLKSLDMWNSTQITSKGVAHLKGLTNLEYLSLAHTGITDDALAHLVNMKKLKQLAIGNTRITEIGMAHLAKLPALERLYLNSTEILDSGLVHLKPLKNLKVIYLSDTKITNNGLKHLATMTQLKSVDLSRTKVSASGITKLKEHLPNTDISEP